MWVIQSVMYPNVFLRLDGSQCTAQYEYLRRRITKNFLNAHTVVTGVRLVVPQ